MPKKSGFTLIELLVVIAIIAILATIGFASFVAVQKNARDTKRRTEIDSIAKALEIRYQVTSGNTCPPGGGSSSGGYYCPLDIGWFSNNVVPTDSVTATPYCMWYNNTNTDIITNPSSWKSTGTCPSIPSTTTINTGIASGQPALNNATNWKICAVMEKDDSVYCMKSKQ